MSPPRLCLIGAAPVPLDLETMPRGMVARLSPFDVTLEACTPQDKNSVSGKAMQATDKME